MQFPIGIDPERFIAALETDVVKSHVAELRARFAGRKVGTHSCTFDGGMHMFHTNILADSVSIEWKVK